MDYNDAYHRNRSISSNKSSNALINSGQNILNNTHSRNFSNPHNKSDERSSTIGESFYNNNNNNDTGMILKKILIKDKGINQKNNSRNSKIIGNNNHLYMHTDNIYQNNNINNNQPIFTINNENNYNNILNMRYGYGINNVNNFPHQPNGNTVRDKIINNNFSPIHNNQINNYNNIRGGNSENKQIDNPFFHYANKIFPNNLFQNQFNNNMEQNKNESKSPYNDRQFINNSKNILNNNSNNMLQSQKKKLGSSFREPRAKQKNKNRNLKDSYQEQKENIENIEKEDTLIALIKGGALKENEEEIKTDIKVKEFLEYKNKENNIKKYNNYNDNNFNNCNNMKIYEKKYFLNYKNKDMDNQNQPQYFGGDNNCIGGNDLNILNINTNDGVKIILEGK